MLIFWTCKFAHTSTNKSSGLWSVHNKEMSVVRGSVGILRNRHPLNIPCSSFACGSLKMHRCLVCVLQSWLWGSEEVWCECLTSTELLGCASGSWLWVCHDRRMNVSVFLNQWFYECFLCSVFLTKCESPPHQNKLFFNSNRFSITPSNEWITLWWQSHSWCRGRAKVTDGNRSLLKQMMSDGSSLCAGR